MFNTDEINSSIIRENIEPQPFRSILDDENCQSEIEHCQRKDILWALAGSVSTEIAGGETLPKLGSWTAFNRAVTKKPLPTMCPGIPPCVSASSEISNLQKVSRFSFECD